MKKPTLAQLTGEFKRLKNPGQAKILQRFFKTGKGQYGEGDIFLGIKVPRQRQLAKKYQNLGFPDLKRLLESPVHEHRLTALFILVRQYSRSTELGRKKIYNFYLKHLDRVNNWDMVDLSAPKIVGHYIFSKNKDILKTLAKSNKVWARRVAVLATQYFINQGRFTETLVLAKKLLSDRHDLIHKAVGWMLREIGKRDQNAEEQWLKKHYRKMPRTMLRYAIEKFSPEKRIAYL